MQDSLKVIQNKDGSFSCEWDKNDPKCKFLNNLTSKEIQVIVEMAMNDDKNSSQ